MSDNLFLQHRERNLLGQKSVLVRKLQKATLKLLLLFYFSKGLSLLYFETKISEAYGRFVFPYVVGVYPGLDKSNS